MTILKIMEISRIPKRKSRGLGMGKKNDLDSSSKSCRGGNVEGEGERRS